MAARCLVCLHCIVVAGAVFLEDAPTKLTFSGEGQFRSGKQPWKDMQGVGLTFENGHVSFHGKRNSEYNLDLSDAKIQNITTSKKSISFDVSGFELSERKRVRCRYPKEFESGSGAQLVRSIQIGTEWKDAEYSDFKLENGHATIKGPYKFDLYEAKIESKVTRRDEYEVELVEFEVSGRSRVETRVKCMIKKNDENEEELKKEKVNLPSLQSMQRGADNEIQLEGPKTMGFTLADGEAHFKGFTITEEKTDLDDAEITLTISASGKEKKDMHEKDAQSHLEFQTPLRK